MHACDVLLALVVQLQACAQSQVCVHVCACFAEEHKCMRVCTSVLVRRESMRTRKVHNQ